MRPRTDPLEPDDAERLLEEADFAAPEAVRPAEDEARLVAEDVRLPADDVRFVADDVRFVADEPPLRALEPRLPEDFALEERLDVEGLDVERLEPEPEPEEDRVRLLVPLLVAISMLQHGATPGSATDNWCNCGSGPRKRGCIPT
jgi:hypothetical protein